MTALTCSIAGPAWFHQVGDSLRIYAEFRLKRTVVKIRNDKREKIREDVKAVGKIKMSCERGVKLKSTRVEGCAENYSESKKMKVI